MEQAVISSSDNPFATMHKFNLLNVFVHNLVKAVHFSSAWFINHVSVLTLAHTKSRPTHVVNQFPFENNLAHSIYSTMSTKTNDCEMVSSTSVWPSPTLGPKFKFHVTPTALHVVHSQRAKTWTWKIFPCTNDFFQVCFRVRGHPSYKSVPEEWRTGEFSVLTSCKETLVRTCFCRRDVLCRSFSRTLFCECHPSRFENDG